MLPSSPVSGTAQAGVVAEGRRVPRSQSGARAVSADAPIVVLWALIALGAVLRFALIGHQGYWLDEGITIEQLHRTFGGMLHALRFRESTPPLYYMLAWGWARVFGFGEAPLRSLSAVVGLAMVPTAYLAGQELVSRRVGLIAAALTACSPLLVWYSQEARPYSLVAFLGALSLLTFVRAHFQPTPRRLLAWALASALALFAHYFAAMVVVPEAAWLVFVHRRRWPVRAGVVFVGAVGAALIPLARSQQRFTTWIALSPLSVRLGQLRSQLLLGFGSPSATVMWVAAILMVVLAIVLLIWRGDQRERLAGLGMAALGAVGFVLAMIVVAAGTDVINTRNLIELWLPLAIAVAVGLGVRRAGPIGIAGAAVLCAIGIASTVYIDATPNLQRSDWRPVSRALGAATVPRALLLIRYGSLYPLRLYDLGLNDLPKRGAALSEVDMVWVNRAPRVEACWWGAACELVVSPMRTTPSIKGFRVVSEARIGQFTLLRLRAPTATHLTPRMILRALPPGTPHRLLFETAQA